MTPALRRRLAPLLPLLLALSGCAALLPPAEDLATSAWARASHVSGALPDAAWTHQVYGNRKPTRYTPVEHQGRAAVLAQSDAGNSTLRLRLAPQGPAGGSVAFSWYVVELNLDADLGNKDTNDAVVRVILTFDGDRSRLGRRDHMLSELVQLVTGEPLPYATLMYVWDPALPVGTVVPNPNTRRIRKLVIESGPERLGRWLDYERDLAADFQHAFGEAPGPLTGVGVMTDTNNTESKARAWYGPLTLKPALTVGRQP